MGYRGGLVADVLAAAEEKVLYCWRESRKSLESIECKLEELKKLRFLTEVESRILLREGSVRLFVAAWGSGFFPR